MDVESVQVPILWLFMPIVLVLGIVTSYQDIRWGIVRNRSLLIALAAGIALYTGLSVLYFDRLGDVIPAYVGKVLLNTAIAFFTAYFLWTFDFWSAGDGKLFVAIAFLMPIEAYSHWYVSPFPSLLVLINAYILVGICVASWQLAHILVRWYRQGYLHSPRKLSIWLVRRLAGWAVRAPVLIAVYLVFSIGRTALFPAFSGSRFLLLMFVAFFFALPYLDRFAAGKRMAAAAGTVVSACGLYVFIESGLDGLIPLLVSVGSAGLLMAFLYPLHALIRHYRLHGSQRVFSAADVKSGARLSPETWEKIRDFGGPEPPEDGRVTESSRAIIIEKAPSDLALKSPVELPLAPFIVLGALTAMWPGRPLILFLRDVFG